MLLYALYKSEVLIPFLVDQEFLIFLIQVYVYRLVHTVLFFCLFVTVI